MKFRCFKKSKSIRLMATILALYCIFKKPWQLQDQSSKATKDTLYARLRIGSKGNATVAGDTVDEENEDLQQSRCQYGYFRLPGMADCHPWLNCSNIYKNITTVRIFNISYTYSKEMSLSLWKENKVVVSTIKRSFRDRGYTTLDLIREFQHSSHVIQLVGFCRYTYITQFHPYGDARNLHKVFLLPSLSARNNLRTRLQMCVSYIEVINFLHTRPDGPRVFCDSANLRHTLMQFLITDELDIVLADLDYMYHANSKLNQTTDCYPVHIYKPFNSPESLRKPKAIDERSDVWKIPDVCDHFIGSWNTSIVSNALSNIRSRCKKKNPSRRPTSGEVLAVYKHVLYEVMNRT